VILGLDISTSCTGWCVFDNDGKFINMGAFKTSKEKSFFAKCNAVRAGLHELIIKFPIEKVYVEENMQAFRPGFSSAKTLMTLAQFNGIIRWICHDEFRWPVDAINVNTARKVNGIKKKKGDNTKEVVHLWVQNDLCDNSCEFTWPYKVLKSGPNRGQTRLDTSSFDMADAYVIAKASFKIENL